jgi:cellulose synthase/poly-beta-1,6-N-acetylglucosamine synthase-like glycosyltransferase
MVPFQSLDCLATGSPFFGVCPTTVFLRRSICGISRVARRFRKGQLPVTNEQPPVSIIVCAQDKADDLLKHLPFLLDQDYPDYQVVVVNAASSDHTEDVLQSFESNSRLYHTFLPVGVKG